MTNFGNSPAEHANFEVRSNQRRFRKNVLFIVGGFLVDVALAVFASGALHFIGLAGAVVTGIIGLWSGIAGEIQIRRNSVTVTLSYSGVAFRKHDPVSWENIREVRLLLAKPRWFFSMRPLHYIAFLPAHATDLSRLSPRERLVIKAYGTQLLLMTETVTPAAEDILSAVERLSDVPVRR